LTAFQQIDRIIQSFADSCGRKCDEAVKMKIFSEDPKRASDTAFLLAYSIIMLNTDRHNKVIREDKKMSKDAFVRNNSDYGRDITEKGKELPREFLEGIYDSINEEEIRTEAEGAEGNMTVERWKDVLRGSTVSLSTNDASTDPVDLKELVVESIWMPVVSAIGAFWAVIRPHQHFLETHELIHSGMLSAQGARLGMDIALELLAGVRNVGRIDIFQQIYCCICSFTGLLGEYQCDAVERTSIFVNSVEAQSAVIVSVSRKMPRTI
jgi:Sec7 domain